MKRGNYYYERSILSTFTGSSPHATNAYGYGKSYTALARLSGLNVVTVPGQYERVYNKVSIGGKWYNLAPAHESLTKKSCTFNYFLKSDAKIKKLNKWLTVHDAVKGTVPACKKNYK
ncbi:MAG: hypothetical protein IJT96_09005 [Lachnospiraceae bacterium]|nr:hypothetical protein [Lachnospiraceae bacterium]